MKAARTVTALLALAKIAAPASAHDFRIDAVPFRVPVGGVVRVSLHHGEGFMGEPVPRDPTRIESFQLDGPHGAQPVLGRSGSITGFAKPEEPGLHLISYHSARVRNELPADNFEAYLREKGLDQVAKLRAERGERGQPGHEVYSRCAKALVWAGDPSARHPAEGASPSDRALGLPLEIVAEGNPGALRAGDWLGIKLLYRGSPLPGATVVALSQADPTRPIASVTDAEGRARFRLPAPGAWMITSVHMIEAPRDAQADWESFWASLTFELSQPAPHGEAGPSAVQPKTAVK